MRELWLKFGDKAYSRQWLADHPDAAQTILSNFKGKGYPLCLCKQPYPELYIARKSRYYLARKPLTGHLHAPDCPEYEPESQHCGRNHYDDGAIRETENGDIMVRLDVPIRISPSHAQRPRSLLDEKETARRPLDRERLKILGLLHLLWDRARFNRWYPKMRGHRRYRQLHKYLLRAAEHIHINQRPLLHHLYIPEPFDAESAEALSRRAHERLRRLTTSTDQHPMRCLVAGLVKKFVPSEYGTGIRLAHAPSDIIFWMSEAQTESFSRHFNPRLRFPDERLHFATIFSAQRTERGHYRIDRIAGMVCSPEYIPVNSPLEARVVQAMIQRGRSFIRPLAYDSNDTGLPNFLLLDADPDRPIPMFLLGLRGGQDDEALKSRLHQYRTQGVECWVWDTHIQKDDIPALPPVLVTH